MYEFEGCYCVRDNLTDKILFINSLNQCLLWKKQNYGYVEEFWGVE